MPYEDINAVDFEDYIAEGATIDDLKKLFICSWTDLDRFCRKQYNLDLATAYNFWFQKTLREYLGVMRQLASAGNATAINTINQIVLKMTNTSDVRVTVSGAVPKEVDAESSTDSLGTETEGGETDVAEK